MATTLWQTVLRFDPSKIAPEIAARNTLGIVIPLGIGISLGNTSAGVVGALGALNVCYSDSRDPYPARARRMLLASLLVAAAVSVGAISAHSNISAIIAAVIWAFAIGMMVILGPKAGDLGAVTLVTLLIFAARSLTFTEALESGLIAFCGGLIQTLLAVAFWPVKPWEPERRIISALYNDLATTAISPAGAAGAPPGTASFVGAQQALASLSQNQSAESERLVFLLSQAERIRLSLLTLRRLATRLNRDPLGHDAAAGVQHILSTAADVLQSISDKPASLDAVNDAARAFHLRPKIPASAMLAALTRDAHRHVDALTGQLRAAVTPPDRHHAVTTSNQSPDLFSPLALLQANLTLQSTAFRHALRMAVCIGIGDTLGRSLSLPRAYWLPVTIAIVLKPDFTATFSRGILRIAGTLAGLLLATVCFHFLHTGPATDIALVAAFTFLGRWIGPANYGIFVSALSAIAVLFIAMSGSPPMDAVAARAINTAIGGSLALATYWVWPTWERTQINTVISEMLEAYRRYFHALMNGSASGVDATRLPGRLARSNASASVARLAAEPGTPIALANLLNSILVNSNGFIRAALALESTLSSHPPEYFKQFGRDVDTTLAALVEASARGSAPPASLPDLRQSWITMEQSEPHTLLTTETDRIATSLNTLREQITQWSGTR